MSRRNTEYHSCVGLVEWWAYVHRGYKLPESALFHIPNQGVGAARGFHLKKMGVRAGVSDYFLMVPKNGKSGLFIEMKSLTGKPSDSQVSFLETARGLGYECAVCKSSMEARETIEAYLSK